jgi:hypothetical protein
LDKAVIGIEPLLNSAAITSKNGIRNYSSTLEPLNLPENLISTIGVFDESEYV